MTHPLYVAFIWHQHQPLYKSRVAGQYRMPWVRLHGTKDYLDLVLLLSRFPKLHQTVNLVPSLILQLEDYAAGTATDPYLERLLTPTKQFAEVDYRFILDRAFDAHHRTMIDIHPRYCELYEQRQEQGHDWCLANWQPQDFADAMTWHNLAWIDPLFWDDPDMAQWLEQGRDFSLSDRQRIYAKQREIIGSIIPQHQMMQDQGQLEITTTPYTHPILPLLADTDAGQVAVPLMTLPEQRFQWAEDIPRHLRKAKAMYEERFGRSPRGLWPSEQSVSPAILPDVAQHGFQWLCSDEAVLGWSLDHFFHRDGSGSVEAPDVLYRPYRLETEHGDLAIVFRDHRLSDLIGFTYGSMEPKQAAIDLVGQLEAIVRKRKDHDEDEARESQDAPPWLVTIALDGENCWEFYEQDGKPFLEHLYGILSQAPGIELVTVSEFLEKFPPTQTIPTANLHSGSWIDGTFTTWIGDPAKNRAWDLLTAARKALAEHPEATEASNPEAWEALYAAEGSDWFWWFGEGHSSHQDDLFDQLFREHLCAVYQSLKLPIPAELYEPIEVHLPERDRTPDGFIHPVIDGYGDEQDWERAGRVAIGGARGTMHRSSPIQWLWYGVDHLNFYLRLDLAPGVQLGADCPGELHVFWFYPNQTMLNSALPLRNVPERSPLDYGYHHHLGINLLTQTTWLQEAEEHGQWHQRVSRAQVGVEACIEIAIPWADLQTEPDWELQVVAVLANDGVYVEHLPENKLVAFTVP